MMKFYICEICGNLIEMINDSEIVPSCCGQDMTELVPGVTDGAKERHIPVYEEQQDQAEMPDSNGMRESRSPQHQDAKKTCMRLISIQVGDLPHPMTPNHSIEWILLQTNKGIYRKNLGSSDTPTAVFCLNNDEQLLAVYSYCNLHGLWANVIS